MLIEVAEATYVEARAGTLSDNLLGRMKDLRSQSNMFRELVLALPAEEPVVPVAGAVVEPVASTAIGLEVTPLLLQPDRNKDL